MAFIDRRAGTDPTGGLFGDITRGLNIPEFGISELFGGEQESLYTSGVVQPPINQTLGTPQLPVDQTSGTYDPQTLPGGTAPAPSPDGTTAPTDGTTINVGGADITYTDSGDILGLAELKETQGYLDYAANNDDATGGGYLDYLEGGGGEEDLINQLFEESSGLLDQQEQLLMESKPDLMNLAGSPYDQATIGVTEAGETGEGRFEEGTGEVQASGRSLLSDAQRLFNELRQRNTQMFGGAALSSTGQAAGEILGREAQRQFGGIREQTAKAVQTLQRGLIDFKNEIDGKLQTLELQKSEALSRAELAFRDGLQMIASQRVQLAAAKADAQLELLREFRQQVSDIQAQERAFRQAIELAWEQAKINTQTQLTQVQGATTAVGGQIGDINTVLQGAGATLQGATTSGTGIEQPQTLSGRYTGRKDQEENIFGATPEGFVNTSLFGPNFRKDPNSPFGLENLGIN